MSSGLADSRRMAKHMAIKWDPTLSEADCHTFGRSDTEDCSEDVLSGRLTDRDLERLCFDVVANPISVHRTKVLLVHT
jgi:hypothetical protein